MRIKIYSIILILTVLCTGVVHSQERHTEICIDFRVNSVVIDSTYLNNAARIQQMMEFLRDIRQDSTLQIVEVSFNGAASPEGSKQINTRLAQGRLSAIEKFVCQEVNIPDSLITRNDSYIPWSHFISLIKDSEYTWKDEVIAILNEEDVHSNDPHYYQLIAKLKALEKGRVWQQINKLFLQYMRNACAVFVTYRKELPPVQEPVIVPDTMAVAVPEPEPVIEAVTDTIPVQPVVAQSQDWVRQLHIKTNLLGWGLAIANIAVEVDICKHLSLSIPVYYSSWDYFKPTQKFRTFTVQPEARYWFNRHNEGWFLGAHFGFGYYNFSLDGEYRTQDYNRETPSVGGGLSMGYRTHLSKNKRWKMEFSVGGGIYDSHYNKFRNEENGFLVRTEKKTWYGVDQAAISFVYAFNLSRKGGKR